MGREVAVTWLENLKTEVRVGKHAVIADEPEDKGGDDAGPTPVDYVLVALGSCTVLTVKMYADRKKWPLDRIEAKLTRQPPQGKIDTIAMELILGGDLDDEQRKRLMDVAERCPVHRTLTEGLRVVRS